MSKQIYDFSPPVRTSIVLHCVWMSDLYIPQSSEQVDQGYTPGYQPPSLSSTVIHKPQSHPPLPTQVSLSLLTACLSLFTTHYSTLTNHYTLLYCAFILSHPFSHFDAANIPGGDYILSGLIFDKTRQLFESFSVK